MKFRYIFVGLLMVFVMSMAMEAAGGEVKITTATTTGTTKEATITFDASGTITDVQAPGYTVSKKNISGIDLSEAKTSFITLVGPSDPCIVQGGQAYCW